MGDHGDERHHDETRHDDEASRLTRLADEELPALIARFEQSGLGELEIHRGAWKVRLRRSAPVAVEAAGPSAGRSAKRSRTAESEGGRPAAPLGAVPRDPAAPGSSSGGSDGVHASVLAAVGPGRGGEAGGSARRRRVATSPAVGYFSPLDGLTSGHQVRSGDLLGHVDVLGVRQEVVAPMDGIVVRVLAEAGQAVEYGEELVRVDVMSRPSESTAAPAAQGAAPGLTPPGRDGSA